MINTYEDEEDDYVSRTVDKKTAEAAQVLGERLIALRPEQLDQLDLSQGLHDALLEAKRLTAHGAIRRQRQYIGKLMRDEILEPIEAKLSEWEFGRKTEVVRMQRMEQWRDRLLADDQAVEALMQEYPAVDVQHVRTLIRNARKQQAQNQPPKSSRELFQYLKGLVS